MADRSMGVTKMKREWGVWNNYGVLLGRVWAERKYQAQFLAEKQGRTWHI